MRNNGIPTQQLEYRDGEYGVYCHNCGNWHGMDVDDPDNLPRHPATPLDEPVTAVCHECNSGLQIIE